MGAHPKQATAEGELEKLFVEESPKMWRSLLAYSRDREIASDAVAEAFALALESSDRISSPEGWLWRVAFRTATAELKRRRRMVGEVPERSQDLPAPASELLSTLGSLSPRQRGVIVLHYYADRPVKDVARILGTTPPAVRVHLMRGRKRLRELLETRDE